MVTSEQVLSAFRRRIQNNTKLARLLNKAVAYDGATVYSTMCGEELSKVVQAVAEEFSGMDASEVYGILEPSLRENYGQVLKYCKNVQKSISEKAGLGINMLEPAYSETIARNAYRVAEGIAESVDPLTVERLTQLVAHAGMTVADETMRVNAEAAANMGLECHIVRTYDGVGLHDGKTPCRWCMDRVGDWTDYNAAKSAGAFERHPGCGCRIDYTYGKTRTWSRSAGRWSDK